MNYLFAFVLGLAIVCMILGILFAIKLFGFLLYVFFIAAVMGSIIWMLLRLK